MHGYKESGDQRRLNTIKIGDLPVQETCAKSSPNSERDLAEVLVFKAFWETLACQNRCKPFRILLFVLNRLLVIAENYWSVVTSITCHVRQVFEPGDDHLTSSIDLAHPFNLRRFLIEVRLIIAREIDPSGQRLGLHTQPLQRRIHILRNSHRRVAKCDRLTVIDKTAVACQDLEIC